MTGRITIEDASWPLVVVRLPSAPLSDDDYRRLVADIALLHERGPFALVYDAPRITLPTTEQRRIVATSIRETERRFPGVLVAIAVATDISPVFLGVIRAISWLAPQRQPQLVSGNLAEALAWARVQLDEHLGVRVPPTRDELR